MLLASKVNYLSIST